MYSPRQAPAQGADPDKLYILKIRSSIDELHSLKQAAIAADDFTTADQMHGKISALQLQLMRLDDQFNAELVKNIVTCWISDLAAILQAACAAPGPAALARSAGIAILQAPAHTDFVVAIRSLPANYLDACIRAVLVIDPQELPDAPKSPFGWDMFLSKKIPALAARSSEVADAVRATVSLAVFDTICSIIGFAAQSDIRRETFDLILRHAFNYFHSAASRKIGAELESRIFEKIFIRLAVVIGDIATVARRDLYRYTTSYLDPQRKIASEEIIMALSSIRYIPAIPTAEDEAKAFLTLFREFVTFHDRTRKMSLRISAIQAIDRLIRPLEFGTSGQRPPWLIPIWTDIADLYKRVRKGSSVSDDERPASLHLLATILVIARFDFFAQNIDSFLNLDLFPKGKIRPFAYDIILQLLRGRYFVDTHGNWRLRANGTFVPGISFGSLTRAPEDQSQSSLANRLNSIAEIVFHRRKVPIPDEHLDVCSDILVQIAAGNLKIGLKLISTLSDTNTVESGPDALYIASRSLSIILNPDSSFSTYAYSRNEQGFADIIKEFSHDLEPNFARILNTIELQIGVGVMGTAGIPFEIPLSASGSRVTGGVSGLSASNEARLQEDLLAMLSTNTEYQGSLGQDDDVHPSTPGQPMGSSTSLATNNQSGSANPPATSSIGHTPWQPTFAAFGRIYGSASEKFGLHSARAGSMSLASGNGASGNTGSAVDSQGHPDQRTSIIDNNASFRRESQFGLNALALSHVVQDASTREANEKIRTAIRSWHEACGIQGKSLEKYAVATILVDQSRVRKRAALRLKSEQRMAIRLLKEVLGILPFMPFAEFIAGNLFVGAYIHHVVDDVSTCAAQALCSVFELYPALRLSILNGFVNFQKSTPHQDDISTCSIVNVMSHLVKIWVDDHAKTGPIDENVFMRVSCKIDALMLLLLSRSCSRIRKAAIQILVDLYTIQQSLPSFRVSPMQMPLAAILVQAELSIRKYAVYGFLEKGLYGHLLSPRVASSLLPASFIDAASSDYAVLFRYYLGELARRFVSHGRSKARRHCAKFLRLLAVPYINSAAVSSPQESATFSGYMVLMMALSGVEMTSDVSLDPGPKCDVQSLLFREVKLILPQLIGADKFGDVKPVLESFYFIDRSVAQAFVVELLEVYSEVRHNSPKIMSKRIFDNILYALRRLAQCPEFEGIVDDTPVFPTTLRQMYVEFITLAGVPLSDVSFLSSSTSWRLKTAINYCVIVQRLAGVLTSIKSTIQNQQTNAETRVDIEQFITASWRASDRLSTMSFLREWYEIIVEITPTIQATPDIRKSIELRRKLLAKASLAAQHILMFGNVFGHDPIPNNMLGWLTALESNGYRVFTPELLYRFEEALGTVLANSYSSTTPKSIAFHEAIFEQVLPCLDDGARQFLIGTNHRMSYAEDYFASIHMLPPRAPDTSMPVLVYPDINRDDAVRLRQHFGSLLFFGLFNLINVNKAIRNRSFIFVRELLHMFSPDDSFNVDAYFSSLTGAFYSNTGSVLCPKILSISARAAEVFAGDSGSFLWEAVRCYRSMQRRDVKAPALTLVPSRRWVFELIVPWCRFADFSRLPDDVVNVEFFRFIMDAAFQTPVAENLDQVSACWTEIAVANDNGSANSSIMVDVVVHVASRFEDRRATAVALMTTLFESHPDLVASALSCYLTSAAFPWGASDAGAKDNDASNPAAINGDTSAQSKFQRRVLHPQIKEFVISINASNTANKYKDPILNEYTLLCRGAVVFASELMRQNFDVFVPYLSVLVNFMLVHFPARIQDAVPAASLLVGLVEGFVSWVHAKGINTQPQFQSAQALVRQLMSWFEAPDIEVVWDLVPRTEKPPVVFSSGTGGVGITVPIVTPVHSSQQGLSTIPVSDQVLTSKEFVDMILSIFIQVRPNIRSEIAREAVDWLSEGYLNSDVTCRAIELYTFLLSTEEGLTMQSTTSLTGRLLDQLAVLCQLESDIVPAQTAAAAAAVSARQGLPACAYPSGAVDGKSGPVQYLAVPQPASASGHISPISSPVQPNLPGEKPALSGLATGMMSMTLGLTAGNMYPNTMPSAIGSVALNAVSSAWANLSKGKIGLKVSAQNTLLGILRVHAILLEKYANAGQLSDHSDLFWPVLGLLRIPTVEFSDVYITALENLTYYIDMAGVDALRSPAFLHTWDTRLESKFGGVQPMIVHALFSRDEAVQSRSVSFLLVAWLRLPKDIVDPSESAMMYTCLYTMHWIFVRLYDTSLSRDQLVYNTEVFKSVLKMHGGNGYQDAHGCLQEILNAADSRVVITDATRDEMLDRCVRDTMSPFVANYVNNMTDFVAQVVQLDGVPGSVALRMASAIWSLVETVGVENNTSMRTLVRRMPLRGEARAEVRVLYRNVLKDKYGSVPIKDIDVVSQGRTEPFVEFDLGSFCGSVKSAATWLSNDLGVKVTNSVFSALLMS